MTSRSLDSPGSFDARAPREVKAGIRVMARLGYSAKGVVYASVAVFALRAAWAGGGSPEGSRGAIRALGEGAFGHVLLALLGGGLAAYALWRGIEVGFDPRGVGTGWKGLAHRGAWAASGLAHLGLSIFALMLVFGRDGGSDDRETYVAMALTLPLGRFLVGAVGLVVGALALAQLQRAFGAGFMAHFGASMSAAERRWARRAGRAGLTARGVLFALAAWFLARAAFWSDADEVRGLAGALRALLDQPFGPWLLGATAVGLLAYACLCFLYARHRRFPTPG